MIYFDNAGTTLYKPKCVVDAVTDSFNWMGNAGRGGHGPTLNAARMIYDTRLLMAELIHAEGPECIAFTSNATESLNIAIEGLIEAGDHVITTVSEHNSVLRPLYRKEKKLGVELTFISAQEKTGILDFSVLEASIRSNTRAMIISHASNLTGNLVDLEKLGQFAKQKHLLLIVDAAQTAGTVPIDVQKMGIDVLCCTGHKGLMGPQGTGAIYVRSGIRIPACKVGGSGIHSYDHEHPGQMPEVLEAGTLNGHGLAGLHAALQYLLEYGVSHIREKEMALCRKFIHGISDLDDVQFYGNPDLSRRVAIATINIGTMDSALVADWLWGNYEIAVRAGAHCAPLMHETLGTVAQGAVRFSFSYINTEKEVETAIEAVRKLTKLI